MVGLDRMLDSADRCNQLGLLAVVVAVGDDEAGTGESVVGSAALGLNSACDYVLVIVDVILVLVEVLTSGTGNCHSTSEVKALELSGSYAAFPADLEEGVGVARHAEDARV